LSERATLKRKDQEKGEAKSEEEKAGCYKKEAT
jgi:hypothetical protein